MRRRFIWELFMFLILCINCIIAYAVFLLLNVGYYYYLAIASLVSFAIGLIGLENRRRFLKELFVLSALCINYTCAITFSDLLKLPDGYFFAILIIVSFLAGVFVVDFRKSFILICVSLVVSVFMATGIEVAAPIMYGEPAWKIDIVLSVTLNFVFKRMLVGGIFCIISMLVGWFVNELLE